MDESLVNFVHNARRREIKLHVASSLLIGTLLATVKAKVVEDPSLDTWDATVSYNLDPEVWDLEDICPFLKEKVDELEGVELTADPIEQTLTLTLTVE